MKSYSENWPQAVGNPTDYWDNDGYRYHLRSKIKECFGAKRAYSLCGVELDTGLRWYSKTLDLNFDRDSRLTPDDSEIVAAAPAKIRRILKRFM